MNKPKPKSKFERVAPSSAKYATASQTDGTEYADICVIMGQIGVPMSTSTARNNVIDASASVLKSLCKALGARVPRDDEARMRALTPGFQDALASAMDRIASKARVYR